MTDEAGAGGPPTLAGKNSNTSQFFITFGPQPKLNGKHVVFGEVTDGFEVLDMIEATASGKDEEEKPTVPVVIAGCGIIAA